MCRDAWALHLCLLPHPPPAEPYHHLVEQYGGKRARDSGEPQQEPPSNLSQEENANAPEGKDEVDGERASGSSSSSSSSDDDDAHMAQDDEMDQLLRENSEASSSEEEDQLDPSQPVQHEPRGKSDSKGKSPNRGYDSPASNIAVLMVACWTMRIPIMYMDFIKYVVPICEVLMIRILTRANEQVDKLVRSSVPRSCSSAPR